MSQNQQNVALLTQDPGLVPQTVTVLAGGGPTSQRPPNPAQWFHYYDTDLGRDVIWNGIVWVVTLNGPTGPQGFQGPQGLPGTQGAPRPPAIPTSYTLSGSSTSMPITLTPGTWQLTVYSYIHQNDGGDFEIQGNYSAIVDGFGSATAGAHLKRTGGSGFGRDVHGVGIGNTTFTVGAQVDTTLSITPITWLDGSGSETGSAATCQKIA